MAQNAPRKHDQKWGSEASFEVKMKKLTTWKKVLMPCVYNFVGLRYVFEEGVSIFLGIHILFSHSLPHFFSEVLSKKPPKGQNKCFLGQVLR